VCASNYERGDDARVIHYLTQTDVVTLEEMPSDWSPTSILDKIAYAKPPYHALIDTGALITGLTNLEVATYLLKKGLQNMDGVVYLDDDDKKMVGFVSYFVTWVDPIPRYTRDPPPSDVHLRHLIFRTDRMGHVHFRCEHGGLLLGYVVWSC
jgi:hypothetical protein